MTIDMVVDGWNWTIRRADKQRKRRPIGKRMDAEQYAAWKAKQAQLAKARGE